MLNRTERAVRHLVGVLGFSLATSYGLAVPDEAWNFIEPVIVPGVKSAMWRTNECVRLEQVKIVCESCTGQASVEDREWFARAWERAFGFRPQISLEVQLSGLRALCEDEQYSISAEPGEVRVHAATRQGFRHAFHTLRQIAIADRTGLTRQGWIMPGFQISDKPSLKFRGLHICWFPEQDVVDIERTIRLAAYYKFNYVVLENWGVWRSERHPWFGWADGKMTSSAVRHLVEIAADEGLTLVPQLNVLGHASLSRVRTGNHATLDFAPEYEPLFEPYSGWNWCLSNPEARRIIKELALELHDLFGRPTYFHIGCDEGCPPTCPKCRANDYNELFSSLVKDLAETFQSRDANVMMWHDMLITKGDARFNGFYCNGDARAEQLLDSLPKGVVVCDWYYGDAQEAYPTLEYFISKGHPTLTCPLLNPSGIAAQGKYAREHGLLGYLGTTWAEMYGRNYPEVMLSGAAAAWGAPRAPTWLNQDMTSPCNYHLRQVGHDMGLRNRLYTGFDKEQMCSRPVTH